MSLRCTLTLWSILLDFFREWLWLLEWGGGRVPFCPSSAMEGVTLGKAASASRGPPCLAPVQARAPRSCPLLPGVMVADGGRGSVAGGDYPGYEVGVGCLERLLID